MLPIKRVILNHKILLGTSRFESGTLSKTREKRKRSCNPQTVFPTGRRIIIEVMHVDPPLEATCAVYVPAKVAWGRIVKNFSTPHFWKQWWMFLFAVLIERKQQPNHKCSQQILWEGFQRDKASRSKFPFTGQELDMVSPFTIYSTLKSSFAIFCGTLKFEYAQRFEFCI